MSGDGYLWQVFLERCAVDADLTTIGLMDALDAAAKLFEEALWSAPDREALGYAEGRGISRETLKEFRIGYAAGSRDALKVALIKKGFTEAQYPLGGAPLVIAHGFVSPRLRNAGEDDIVDELRVIVADEDRATAYVTFSSRLRPPLRQAVLTDGSLVPADDPALAGPPIPRAENDVGGLLDTSKGWTLNIPMPSESSAATSAMAKQQTVPTEPAKPVTLASRD